jgi:replicative DNA helicase
MESNLNLVKNNFKELPNNIEAEQSVIGSILVSNEIFDEINTIISYQNFYDPMHQKIFNSIESLIYKGMLANPITLNSEKLLFDLAERGSFNSSLIKFDEAMKQTIEMASAAYKNEEGIVGVPTGLRDLDDRLGGLHQSDLIIIAGRPGMGKTALATNIAFNAAQKIQNNGRKSSIAFFSLEMSSEQLSTRILAEQSRIKSNDIRRGKISDEQFDKFLETSKNISELPLYIDETPAISIAALSNRARRIKRIL